MSFVDELKNNYRPENDLTREEIEKRWEVKCIIWCIEKGCSEASQHSRTLEGYYCLNYDGHYIGKKPPKIFFYNNFGKSKAFIEKKHPGIICFSKNSRDKIIENVKNELIKLGFHDFDVHAEDILSPLHVGYTSFLGRNKIEKFPSFSIYIKVIW